MIAATLPDMSNRPAPPLLINASERETLRSLARAGRTEQRIATRARIVLGAAEGRANRAIADELRVSPMTVLLWRGRFRSERLAGLRDAPWLGRHSRITFHFTPTSASWLNQIETWFSVLTRQAIRRGSFRSVTELIALIDTFTRNWNSGASPFIWVKTADEILAKAVRKAPAFSESGH